MFKELSLPRSLNTSKNDPIDDFFIPVLEHSISYNVAVGYFSSEWIKHAAKGIAKIALKGGKIRWIIGPQLSKEDIDILTEHSNDQETIIQSLFEDNINLLIEQLSENTRTAICWMIKDDILEFKIAVPKNNLTGIFHIKEGYFEDQESNLISFDGSYNTTGAANFNWEKINIFKDNTDMERALDIKNDFEEKWNNRESNLTLYEPSLDLLNKIKLQTHSTQRNYDKLAGVIKESEFKQTSPKFPYVTGPREYQIEAYKSWLENDKNGLFAMATGTGKTITALNCILEEYKKDGSYQIIILVPNKHLVRQWENEVKSFNFIKRLIIFDSSNSQKHRKIINLRNSLKYKETDFVIISTYQSMGNLFNSSKLIQRNSILIADEAHNLGASSYFNTIKDTNFSRIIGLSATPGRFFSAEETDKINRFFSDEAPYCFSFALSDAIRSNFLSKYNYIPVPVYLNELELAEYNQLSTKIVQLTNSQNSDKEQIEQLLLKRKRVINNCEAKVPQIADTLLLHKANIGPVKYCITYVSDGSDESGEELKNLIYDSIQEKFNYEISIAQYTSTSSFSNSHQLSEKLKGFSCGEIDLLLAMKMLDEGVDIPRAEIGILASNGRNPKEFIQRLGRLLRKHPDKRYAYIYDLFVLPQKYPDNETERNLFRNELNRIIYLAKTANNYLNIRDLMEEHCSRFNVSWDIIENEI